MIYKKPPLGQGESAQTSGFFKAFPWTDSILSVPAVYDDTRGSGCMFISP